MTSRKDKGDEGKVSVLVWERDEAARDLIESYCREHGWRVHVVENHEDLEDRASARPELVFVEFPNLFLTREDDLIDIAGRAFVPVAIKAFELEPDSLLPARDDKGARPAHIFRGE